MSLTARANAKINLSLDVLGKREDGYHIVEMIMQSVSLHDTVTVSKENDGEIRIICGSSEVPEDDSNIAARAARAFFETANIQNPGITVRIKKRIPVAAGLAGGSADGAAVIVLLNELFGTGFSDEELADIGEKVGADLPFCVTGGTMLARGTGGLLTPLPPMPDCYIVISKPEMGISTAAAYAKIDSAELNCRPDTEKLSEAICARELGEVAEGLCNVFESALDDEQWKTVAEIKRIMLKNGALGACMSGSGPSVFGIFDDKADASDCADELEELHAQTYVCRPENTGIEIV